MLSKVLIIASGFSAAKVHEYSYREKGWKIIGVSNVYRYFDDFDLLIYAQDIRDQIARDVPLHKTQMLGGPDYMRKWGGIDVAGRGIVITAAYYVLEKFKPDMIGFLGCDMNYTHKSGSNTCIYGIGDDIKKRKMSDPDRIIKYEKDPEYFTKKFRRFEEIADCEVYNFSDDPETRLPFLQVDPIDIDRDE